MYVTLLADHARPFLLTPHLHLHEDSYYFSALLTTLLPSPPSAHIIRTLPISISLFSTTSTLSGQSKNAPNIDQSLFNDPGITLNNARSLTVGFQCERLYTFARNLRNLSASPSRYLLSWINNQSVIEEPVSPGNPRRRSSCTIENA